MKTNNQKIEVRPCNIPNEKGIDATICAVKDGEAVQITVGRRQDCELAAAEIEALCAAEVMQPTERLYNKYDVFELYMAKTWRNGKTTHVSVHICVWNEGVDADGNGKNYCALSDCVAITAWYEKPEVKRVLDASGVIKTTRGTYKLGWTKYGDHPCITKID